jgi:hypothetical protein
MSGARMYVQRAAQTKTDYHASAKMSRKNTKL